MSRTVFLCAALCLLALANAVEIGRPLVSRNKLDHRLIARRSRLGESLAGAAEMEKLEHLRVAAAERETSLADQFADVRKSWTACSSVHSIS